MRKFQDQFRLLTMALLFAACSERPTSSLSDIPIQSLSISGIRINEASFQSNGNFDVGLVALGPNGENILATNIGIAVTLQSVGTTPVAGYKVTRLKTTISQGKNAETWAAVLLDNSGSMSTSDPQKLRADAAKLFWDVLLPARTGNQVSFLDFGPGSTSPFTNTRLLQTWTTSASTLQSKLTSVVASGGTPLYESLLETANWMGTTTTTSVNRVILLMTDGQPNSNTNKAAAIAAAKNANIIVHTVGLGDASDLDPSPSVNAVTAVRDIAEQTGGVYSAATTASALASIFQVLASATSKGQLLTGFSISPVPASGTRVSGTVSVTSGGRSESANFSFLTP